MRKIIRLPLDTYWAEYCRWLHNTGPVQRNVTLLHYTLYYTTPTLQTFALFMFTLVKLQLNAT